jgi:phospholipase C
LRNTAAVKVVGKPFPSFARCGRAAGQQATADLVKRIQDSSAWDSTLITITYDENGGRWDHVPMLDLARNLLPQDLRGRF